MKEKATVAAAVKAGRCSVDRIVGPSCDGRCGQYGTCKGEVRPVTVKSGDGRRTWGRYNYCEVAIAEDEESGYIVLPNARDQLHRTAGAAGATKEDAR